MCGPEGDLQKGVDAVNHIEQDECLIERMFETELPPEEYYTLLRADMGRRHSNAAPEVLDHLLSTEMLLDVATVTGFSFGLDKAEILETRVKADPAPRSTPARSPSGRRSPKSVSYASSLEQ